MLISIMTVALVRKEKWNLTTHWGRPTATLYGCADCSWDQLAPHPAGLQKEPGQQPEPDGDTTGQVGPTTVTAGGGVQQEVARWPPGHMDDREAEASPSDKMFQGWCGRQAGAQWGEEEGTSCREEVHRLSNGRAWSAPQTGKAAQAGAVRGGWLLCRTCLPEEQEGAVACLFLPHGKGSTSGLVSVSGDKGDPRARSSRLLDLGSTPQGPGGV